MTYTLDPLDLFREKYRKGQKANSKRGYSIMFDKLRSLLKRRVVKTPDELEQLKNRLENNLKNDLEVVNMVKKEDKVSEANPVMESLKRIEEGLDLIGRIHIYGISSVKLKTEGELSEEDFGNMSIKQFQDFQIEFTKKKPKEE